MKRSPSACADVDLSGIDTLSDLLGEEDTRALVRTFIASGVDGLGRIRTACAQKNFAALRLLAHDMVTNAGSLKVHALHEIAHQCEAACVSGNHGQALTLGSKMATETERTLQALTEKIGT